MKFIAERTLDELGRIVLPLEVRSANGWSSKTALSLFMEEDGSVLLRAPQRRCFLCGSSEQCQPAKHKWICSACLNDLKSPAQAADRR